MKKHLTITDLTRMKGDRVCIFGVDEDGNGVRPDIGPTGMQEHHLVDKDGRRVVVPFAVIEFDLVRPVHRPPHTEDWEMDPRCRPRLVGTLSNGEQMALLTRLLDESVEAIFDADVHSKQYVNEGEGNRSIGTVRVGEVLAVEYSSTQYGRHEYRIKFADATGEVYDLPITDLAFREYCDSQRCEGHATEMISSELARTLSRSLVFIRVGLARPFAKMYNRCYLQVCAVHAFPRHTEYLEETGTLELADDVDRKSTVLTLLNSSDGSKRAKAAYLLGKTKNPLFVGVLCKATEDPDGNVRRLAASALGKIGDSDAVESLTKLLADAKPQVRHYAIKALGDIGDERCVPDLRRLEDPIPYLRRAAKTAVSKICHSRK